ncbi:MAG: hypothetical protein GXO71_02965 [Caldiserica bacterium]|nr:hypothetical protein [Caldisericota bacterium]
MEEKWKELERRVKKLLRERENRGKGESLLKSRIKELEKKVESLQRENLTVKLLRERVKALEQMRNEVRGRIKEILRGIRAILR